MLMVTTTSPMVMNGGGHDGDAVVVRMMMTMGKARMTRATVGRVMHAIRRCAIHAGAPPAGAADVSFACGGLAK